MERKYRILVSIVLLASVLFTTCKTSETRSSEPSFKKTDKLPFAWIAGREVKIDTIWANSTNDLWNESLSEFYASRDYKAAWLTNRQLNKNGEELFDVINSVWQDGLSCEAYDKSFLESKLKEYEQLSAQEKDSLFVATKLDIAFTEVYFKLAADIENGLISPSLVDTVWETYPGMDDLDLYLTKAVNKENVENALNKLKPQSEQYELLKRSYVELIEAKESNEWPVPGYFSGKLEERDSSKQVVKIKLFLATTGDLQSKDSTYLSSQLFDSSLTTAIKAFQQRHGLEVDGVVGRATLAEMNVPVEKRLDQIRVNLDRLRSLPDEFGDEYIAVNIPGFSLEYVKHHKPVKKMNVVVGNNSHATPVLKDTLMYLVFNPEWNVPNSIATNEILPKVKADSTYLVRNNYEVIPYSGANKRVDWSELSPSYFPYRIVQKSGGSNALGMVKFIMPNRHSIYLHDTPSKQLFSKAKRNFSHGCIRLAEPIELAESILDRQLTREEIDEILSGGEPTKVVLDKQIPVHFFYQTTWVDENGQLQFREDIYKHDRLALAQMQKHDQQSEYKALLAENN